MKVIKWQYAALTIIFFLIHACLTFSFHYYCNGIIFLPIWGYIHKKKNHPKPAFLVLDVQRNFCLDMTEPKPASFLYLNCPFEANGLGPANTS